MSKAEARRPQKIPFLTCMRQKRREAKLLIDKIKEQQTANAVEETTEAQRQTTNRRRTESTTKFHGDKSDVRTKSVARGQTECWLFRTAGQQILARGQ